MIEHVGVGRAMKRGRRLEWEFGVAVATFVPLSGVTDVSFSPRE